MARFEPFIDPVALEALASRPTGPKFKGLVEWMLCPLCGRSDWVGIEGHSKCPTCGTDQGHGTGPLDYTRVKALTEPEFEVQISREEWAKLLDFEDFSLRQVGLLEAVETGGWVAATALLDEWGIEYEMSLRVPR